VEEDAKHEGEAPDGIERVQTFLAGIGHGELLKEGSPASYAN
jgi:hypothetical protein